MKNSKMLRKTVSCALAGALTFSAMGMSAHAMNASGTTDIPGKMVSVQDSDVTVTSKTTNGTMKSVVPVYDANKKGIWLEKFAQNPEKIVVGEGPDGYPFQYVNVYGDSVEKKLTRIYVFYEKDEDGNPLKDANGNYIIESLKRHQSSSNSYLVLTSNGEPTKELDAYFDGQSGYDGCQYLLKDSKGNMAYAYCVNMEVNTSRNSWYSMGNLSDGDYYATEDAENHVRAIVLNGYWGTANTPDANGQYPLGSLGKIKADLKKALREGRIEDTYNIRYRKYSDSNNYTVENIDITVTEEMIDERLTEGIALEMTQNAIWSWSNGCMDVSDGKDGAIVAEPIYADRKVPENSAIRKILLNYLVNLEPQEEKTVVIDSTNFIEDLKLIVSEDENPDDDIYDVDLKFTMAAKPAVEDDLILKIEYNGEVIEKRLAGQNDADEAYETLVPENGVYTIPGLSLTENDPFDIEMQITGKQELVQDAYMYIPYGGFEAAQPMVGIAEGMRNVDVTMTAEVSFDLDDYIERKINFRKVAMINGEQKGLSGIEFDIYKICTLDEYTENYNDYVETRTMSDGSEKDYVSSEVLDNLRKYPLVETVVTDANGNGQYDLTEDGQPDGIYLVVEKKHPAITQPLLPFYVTVPQTSDDGTEKEYEINLTPKNVLLPGPEIDKDVIEIDQEEASVDMGKEFTWIIRGTIPTDIAKATEYVITDDLDYRLTYAEDLVVKVEKKTDKADNTVSGNGILTAVEDYTVTIIPGTVYVDAEGEVSETATDRVEEVSSLKIELTQKGLAKVAKLAGYGRANSEIRVYFNTIVDGDAKMGVLIDNDADLYYKNSVGMEYNVNSEDPVVYTCGINLYKHDANLDASDPEDALEGAVFQLAKKVDQTAEGAQPLVTRDGLIYVTEVSFYTAVDAETGEVTGENTSVTTDEAGEAMFYGLEAGEYYLIEKQAPEGYNLLSYPVKVILGESSHLEESTVEVANSNRFRLPETGGMGTAIFTGSGMVMLVAAAILVLRKKEEEV